MAKLGASELRNPWSDLRHHHHHHIYFPQFSSHDYVDKLVFGRKWYTKYSSAVAKRPRDASCPSV